MCASPAPSDPISLLARLTMSDLLTPANGITVGRLLASPMLFAMISTKPSWPALLLWFVLCSSDGIDGWLARRMGTTKSGAFLDPLADKVLVLGAMWALVSHRVFWWLPVGLIALREVGISIYRTMVARHGVSVPATRLAKWKTVTQQFAVAFVLLPPLAHASLLPGKVLLWASVVLTMLSGAHYLRHARHRSPVAPSSNMVASS
jgi:CDP-diacylglycerol---glycerol-3-phosphate 3-phosphatidyltransferase